MFDYKNASIQKKFTLGSIFVSVSVLFLTCLIFITYDYITFRQGIVRNLSSIAQITAQNISAAIVFDDPSSAQEILKSLKFKPHIFGAYIYDTNGQLFTSYIHEKGHIPGNFEQKSHHFKELIHEDFKQRNWEFHKGFVEVFSFVSLDKKKIGKIIIVSDLQELTDRMRGYMLFGVIILFVSLGLAFVISFFVSRPISNPIRRLTSMAEKIAQGDLSQKIVIDSKNEVGVLGESFNLMAKDLSRANKDLRITHQKLIKIQEQLFQSEKLKAIGQLSAGVAHEVKNPLAIILQGVEYISTVVPQNDKNLMPVIKDLQEAVHRADAVIRGVLDLSRLSELNMVWVDINKVLDQVLLLLKHQFTQNRISTIRNYDNNLPKVKIDCIKLEQAFMNILLNTIEATDKENIITLTTYSRVSSKGQKDIKYQDLDFLKEGKTIVVIEIEDEGPGIPDDIIDKIFDPFFTTKSGKGGTGLGLPIIKNIIKIHNGRIAIENRKEKKGVKVTVELST